MNSHSHKTKTTGKNNGQQLVKDAAKNQQLKNEQSFANMYNFQLDNNEDQSQHKSPARHHQKKSVFSPRQSLIEPPKNVKNRASRVSVPNRQSRSYSRASRHTNSGEDGDDEADMAEIAQAGLPRQEEEEAEGTEEVSFAKQAELHELLKLDKYHDYPKEKAPQKLARIRNILEGGKIDAGTGPKDVMTMQKKAIIKAAVARARRYERVSRKITKNWDYSSESEECIDCSAPAQVRKAQFKTQVSYRDGSKRASLFTTFVKWFVVLVGCYDFFLTFHIILRIYTYQMWQTYFKAKQYTNCHEAIVETYQLEVLCFCLHMVNSVNLVFSLRRHNMRYLTYWMKTQICILILAPIPTFMNARFNAKDGNVVGIIERPITYHFLHSLQYAIILYRYYMVRNPFVFRRLRYFAKSEMDRQLNQDLDSRLSPFIQKKNSYRNAFKNTLYSVISTIVQNFEIKGKPLNPDEVHELIKKYDEKLNDITTYPGIEQYLRMAYIRFCIKRGPKDQRKLASQAEFYNLRNQRLQRIATQKILAERARIAKVAAQESLLEQEDDDRKLVISNDES